MARRTRMVRGSGSGQKYDSHLGFRDWDALKAVLREHVEVSEIDFGEVERRAGCALPTNTIENLRSDFEGLAVAQLAEVFPTLSEKSELYFGSPKAEVVPRTHFLKLVKKLETHAANLKVTLDELAEFDVSLVFPPRNTRDESEFIFKLRIFLNQTLAEHTPSFEPNEEDMSDYLTFRRTLDYLEKFTEKNKPFNNHYNIRWQEDTDHGLFENLVRRWVVDLRRAGFPMSLTVPTDVAPEYESPIIAVLLYLQDVWNDLMEPASIGGTYLLPSYSYRNMLYLVKKILESLVSWDEILV
ncbi:MAG: hypothetical protein ABJH45_23930 [Paracoccaceae bacterium]